MKSFRATQLLYGLVLKDLFSEIHLDYYAVFSGQELAEKVHKQVQEKIRNFKLE